MKNQTKNNIMFNIFILKYLYNVYDKINEFICDDTQLNKCICNRFMIYNNKLLFIEDNDIAYTIDYNIDTLQYIILDENNQLLTGNNFKNHYYILLYTALYILCNYNTNSYIQKLNILSNPLILERINNHK